MDAVKNHWKKGLVLILVILVIVGLYFLIEATIINYRNLNSPDTIKRIKDDQIAMLSTRWTGITQNKQGLTPTFSEIPDNQRLLINTSVLTTRLVGYSGPYTSGVFDEDNATRIAISSGARCLILEIGRETNSLEPMLIYRDSWGIKQSLNMGSIQRVAKSIAGRAFTTSNDAVPPALANDPLFIVLYFASAPNMGNKPANYVRFLAKVAEQLAPLKGLLVAQTPAGDFRRQALESQLFFQPYTTFSKRIIMLTNADTSAFRNLAGLGLSGEIGPSGDLDLMIHSRLYSKESPSPLGISTTPTNSQSPAAVITTPNYWLQIPPDRFVDAQSQTKRAWTLVMDPISDDANSISQENLDSILVKYGVQSTPLVLFDNKTNTDIFTGPNRPYSKSAWSVKPELLRFIPPKVIIVQKPIPSTNSGGGALVAPSI